MSDKLDPRAPWFPHSPQLDEEPIRHGVWKRIEPFGLSDISDDGLLRLDREHRRTIEDIDDGLEYGPDLAKRRRYCEGQRAVIDLEATLRLLLKRRYNACETGTDSIVSYWDDAPAPRPSYYLALQLDYEQWRLGEGVLDFGPMEAKHGRSAVMRFIGLHGAALLEERMAEAS